MQRPPLKQVAEIAGVSEPTVSRVLNGRPGVAAATRTRVIETLQALGFDDVPSPQVGRRAVIGLVCGEFLNPVFSTFVHHISTELGRRGYLTKVAVADRDLSPEERCIDELVHTRVDGLVFIGGRHTEVDGDWSHYRRLASAEFPMVFVNGTATGLPAPHIWCDEEAGARKAISHLIRLGHRRIGCLLGSSSFVPTERFVAGYRAVLADHDLLEPDDAIVEAPFTLEGGRAGAARLLDAGFSALMAGNDLMAMGAIMAASTRRNAESLSVVGYDGTDFSAFSSPPLTTLRQPYEDMAQLVADAIVAETEGSTRYRDQYLFEPQLIVRESTGPRPATPATNLA